MRACLSPRREASQVACDAAAVPTGGRQRGGCVVVRSANLGSAALSCSLSNGQVSELTNIFRSCASDRGRFVVLLQIKPSQVRI